MVAYLRQWRAEGLNTTVHKQMNVAYFVGYILGWVFGDNGKAGQA